MARRRVGETEAGDSPVSLLPRIVALEKFNRLPQGVTQFFRIPANESDRGSSDRNSSIVYWASLKVQSNEIEASEAGVLGALRGKRS